MNEVFNSKLRSWLDDDSRTIEEGCLLLLQLEGNQIHYHNLMRYPDKEKLMVYLVSELSRRLTARLAKCTHEEVEQMDAQVKVIEKKYFLYRDAPKKGTTDEEFRKGKRADHDQLPEEIQARYVENLPLLQRLREVHLKLRSLSLENVSCPDSERYPFLKELIELDKQIHENWDIYDHYVLTTDTASTTLPAASVLGASPVESASSPLQDRVLGGSSAESASSPSQGRVLGGSSAESASPSQGSAQGDSPSRKKKASKPKPKKESKDPAANKAE